MIASSRFNGRTPICYLAPWVDYGGSDKGTIDWFRWIDRDRFAPILITTQPSPNRRLAEIYRFAEEVWPLPTFLAGQHFPSAIFDLIHSRGVQLIHIMNSRLGYDLLPDLGCLPAPPAVVVQLHVEEPDKSGYVRYVTTRYGNLVDAFSVSSQHLADAVAGYSINSSKIHVIATGVDAEQEFNPSRITPVELAQDQFHILYPARLTEQKDPLLMVDVIRRLYIERPNVHIHVLGDGPLEASVKAFVSECGLDGCFSFHPPTRDLAGWYAACDALLMTSIFEGVPYVIYEAMAMELPVIAPALPGNVELMADSAGALIASRDDAAAYVRAFTDLIDDPPHATAVARAGRRRMLDHFSLRAMGEAHSALYGQLIAGRSHPSFTPTHSTLRWQSTPGTNGGDAAPRRVGLRFDRPAYGQPLVSIIVPCFNHGCFLKECIDSLITQHYKRLEIIVVDDASTDPLTIEALKNLESTDGVHVIRLEQNRGPSAARNRAIAKARGRYILPVDADNILLPDAVAKLVEQIQSAGEMVGYIYPNCQYFGTRNDYFEPPRFNLALLLNGNFCDTCSLIDKDVFDAGFCYAEDIELGHEDWDFALSMAAHGVRGEAATTKTLLYRKHGFTRSDAVEYAAKSFREEIEDRHPELYGPSYSLGRYGRWDGPAFSAKAKYAPSLSLVLTKPVDFAHEGGMALINWLNVQSCCDFELIAECVSRPTRQSTFPITRIPPGLCEDGFALLSEALKLARGKYVLIIDADTAEMLSEPPFVERLYRTFLARPSLEAIAFAEVKETGVFPYRLLSNDEMCGYAHAIAFHRDVLDKLPLTLFANGGSIVERLAISMSANGIQMQWRHATGPQVVTSAPNEGEMRLREPRIDCSHHRQEKTMITELPAALPSLGWGAVRRWEGTASWTPPETDLLTRHREANGSGRVIRLGRSSPNGYILEWDLGAIRRFAPPGTIRLVRDSNDCFRTVEPSFPRRNDDVEFGHLETSPLPLFQAVERAVFPDGSETLVAGEADPLRREATTLEFLGFIEAFPNIPTEPPDMRRTSHGVVGLLRCIDYATRRHVYRVATVEPHDELVGELGALHLWPEPESVAVRVDAGGNLTVGDGTLPLAHPSLRQLLRWSFAPLSWRRFGRLAPRLRASVRRSWEAARIVLSLAGPRPTTADDAHRRETTIVGYLHKKNRGDRRALFVAVHPVTDDHLFVCDPLEATDMGYQLVDIVGYILAQAPATGTLTTRPISVPWGSRFGLEVRRS